MAGKPAGLPLGVRITDRLSLSLLLAKFPGELIDEVLDCTGRQPATAPAARQAHGLLRHCYGCVHGSLL